MSVHKPTSCFSWTGKPSLMAFQSIKDALDQRHSALALFVDFEAAFDNVWRLKCIQKLQTLGVCNNMLMWIRNFISQRFSAVRFGNAISSFKQSETGLPQGSVIN
ncbi:putative RNA-directed DNA polymerase from transposon X-element [Trichonephila clavipes]|uniref:Putative RNA-directed DNA polymerase from transposon X-element n=1 Tax=Trichonephila clavipes TaxID=2585209 RepID=A0A8X6S8Y2_TRICX|nr:putative RNA-directed DNA polymerase from transposon X-element [Trichonephila clavipes]